jgi:hypothetical protein
MSNEWISVGDRLPDAIALKDYSENVFAFCEGGIRIMAYCYIDCHENSGWVWCDCGNDLYGEPEFDDDYKVTHWMPLPTPPAQRAGDNQEKR